MVKIEKVRDVTIKKGTKYSEGYDISLPDTLFLHPNQVTIFKVGVKLNIQVGAYVEVHPRSSMLFKHSLIAQVGIIESDFKGELGYAFYNPTNELKTFKKGDFLLQLIPKLSSGIVLPADVMTREIRGDGGFGSTGR